MVRKSKKLPLESKQQATQYGIELSLGDSLMCFVKEEMRLLNTVYLLSRNTSQSWLAKREVRKTLQEGVRLQQLEIRGLSALRRRRWDDRLESTN